MNPMMKRVMRHMVALMTIGCVTMADAADIRRSPIDSLLAEAKHVLAPDARVRVFEVIGETSAGVTTLKGDVHDAEMKTALMRYLRDRVQGVLVDSLRALPDPALGEMTRGVVAVSVVNLRTSPANGAELATQAILGTPVKILKKKGGWFYMQTPDGYLGWTDDDIEPLKPAAFASWTSAPKVIVTIPYAWVRSAPAVEAEPVADAVAGSLLALADDGGAWFHVKFPDGRSGYLAHQDGTLFAPWLTSVHATDSSIIATARQFMGVPYLWGGTSAKAMDCSGFTKTVFFLNGILLPRDASQQALVGDPVVVNDRAKDIRPGDLLFFGTKESPGKPARVSHVGISLGGGRFIHSSGQVRISSLLAAHPDFAEGRAQSLLGVRRIIGAAESAGVRQLQSMQEYR
jgi:gamma-D-glutamyl-L-lysine dipeptidyl-peptidase